MKFYKLSHDLRMGKKYPQVDCLCPFTASQISPWNKLLCNPNLKFKLKNGCCYVRLYLHDSRTGV